MKKSDFEELYFKHIAPKFKESGKSFQDYLIGHLIYRMTEMEPSDEHALEILQLLYEIYRDCDD